jgi:hypothetical protein
LIQAGIVRSILEGIAKLLQPVDEAPTLSENITSTMQSALTSEALNQGVAKMKSPRFFRLIMQHLRAESKDEIRDSPDYKE